MHFEFDRERLKVETARRAVLRMLELGEAGAGRHGKNLHRAAPRHPHGVAGGLVGSSSARPTIIPLGNA